MPRAILMSIKSTHVCDILNGLKTEEIRKRLPKCDLPIDVFIYCTEAKPFLKDFKFIHEYKGTRFYLDDKKDDIKCLNGKVVAKFTLYEADKYAIEYYNDDSVYQAITKESDDDEDIYETVITNEYEPEEIAKAPILMKSRLTFDELGKYVVGNKGGFEDFYSLHIDNLELIEGGRSIGCFFAEGFSRAYDLYYSEYRWKVAHYPDYLAEDEQNAFEENVNMIKEMYRLQRAPQSYCYIDI